MRNPFANSHPGSKLIFALFIIVASFLITFLIGFLFAIPVFQINISELDTFLSDYSDPNNLNFLKYLQTIQSIGLFIIPAFIIAYLFGSKNSDYLNIKQPISPLTILLSIFILLTSVPIINSLAQINQGMQFPDWLKGVENWMVEKEEGAQKLTESFLIMNTWGDFVFTLIMLAVLPAVGEELIFRGVFQRIFAEWTKNIHWGIIIAAVLFSSMHLQFFGFLPRLILGILLGYMYYWSKSIWTPILGHFINNGTAVVLYYFYKDEISRNIESIGTTKSSLGILIVSITIVSSLLYLFYRENNTQTTN